MVSKPTSFLILVSLLLIEAIITLLEVDNKNFYIQKNVFQGLLILFLLVLVIIIFALMINNVTKNFYAKTSDILEKQIKNQLKYYEQQEQQRLEFRSFKHDYNNHMHCIRSMIIQNETAEAVQYIDTLDKTSAFEHRQFDTGNHIADSILNEKYNAAKKLGISFEHEGLFSADLNAVDLCIVLSNALDNAIEASQNFKGEKYIKVKAMKQQGYQVLRIINTCNTLLFDKNNLPKTSKKDSENHGLGLQNIRNVINKYDGKMKITSSNNSFVLEATIPIIIND